MKRSVTRATIMAAGIALAAFGAASAQSPAGHSMDGTVTKVDAKKGWVDIKTSEGSMKLHFPPPVLESVKKGDSVTVQLGMTTSPGGMSGSTGTTTKTNK